MDRKTIIELGNFLNDRIGPYSTCDHLLSLTTTWLDENGHDVEQATAWLEKNGVECDCQFVVNIYIPTLFGLVKNGPSKKKSD